MRKLLLHSGDFIGEPVFLVVVAKTFCDEVLKMSHNQSAHLGVRQTYIRFRTGGGHSE